MRKKIILLFSLIPFFRIILKYLYQSAIKKMRLLASESSSDILDILLISNMKDHDFIYGSSDLNLILVVKDHVYPKEFLEQTRKKLVGMWPANMLVDIKNLNVLKTSELKTPLIRSTMLTRFESEDIKWQSILTKDFFEFRLKEQDHHNIQFNYVKKLELLLLNPKKDLLLNRHWIRSFGKGVYFSLAGLIKYNLIQVKASTSWEELAKKIVRFTLFSRSKYHKLKIQSLKMLDFCEPSLQTQIEQIDSYEEDFINFCNSLLEFSIVEDIILKPALIQLDTDSMKGKVFVDIILRNNEDRLTSDSLHHLQVGIDNFLSELNQDHPKYVFKFSTFGLLKIKCEQVLFSYPLEYYYRIERCHSLRDFKYKFDIPKRQMEKACIQFLMHEFMQFRTLKQKNILIGSKFIKSLNNIYRYQLLLNFLKGQEFAVSHSYKSIMEELTPQLAHIKPDQQVDQETWLLVRAQMLYILKRIRDELSKKNPSLKNLQF